MNGAVIVKRSTIHGKGLFALKNIQKGQIIGYFKGERSTEFSAYTLWLNENLSVDVLKTLLNTSTTQTYLMFAIMMI